ncbi:MAG: hypothetical protein HN936_10030 [Bacteroidetes bacterium]|jgi:hypothetical protein|nr:hypothetical protein [Bacteroidota bacterium]MBT7093574.1 hypothetical protein [Bacteroidota bacterium]MBT7789579.1 hypothetical protein [Calditrichota bacterium]
MKTGKTIDEAYEAYRKEEEELAEIVSVKEGHVVINAGYEYNISLDTIKGHADILRWTHHLCEKTWMTIRILERFIEVAAHNAGLKIHP